MERKKVLDPIRSHSFRLKLDLLVHAVQAVLPAPLVLRDSREFAVKLVSPAQLAPQVVADREVFLVFLAKMLVIGRLSFLFRC